MTLQSILCTLLTLTLCGQSLAYPYIIRLKNQQKQPVLIQEGKETLFKIMPGERVEFVLTGRSEAKIRYNPGKELANAFRWAHDQSINNLAEQCRINVMDHTDDDLLICAFSFEKKNRSKIGAHTYTLEFDYVVNTKYKGKELVDTLSEFAGKSNLYFHHIDENANPNQANIMGKRNGLKEELNARRALPGLVSSIDFLHKGPRKLSRQTEYQNFIVMGDQGSGEPKAKQVSRDIYAICAMKGCHSAIVVGDNIYPIAPKITDANWQQQFVEKFTKIYQPIWDEWHFPFYVTLGNHDIGVDALIHTDWVYFEQHRGDRPKEHYLNQRVKRQEAQVAYTQRPENPSNQNVRMWNMPGTAYTKLINQNGVSTFLTSIDSNYFPAEVGKDGTSPKSEALSNVQGAWLKQMLSKKEASDARWRIVFGHHAMYSIGRHGVNGAPHEVRADDRSDMLKLRDALLPIFCEAKVDFYMAGHDHHLQIDEITCPEGGANPGHKIVQILSGAAAKMDAENPWGDKILFGDDKAFTKAALYPELRWANDLLPDAIRNGEKARRLLGFAYLSLSKVEANIEMIESTKEGPKLLTCFSFDKKALSAPMCQEGEKFEPLFLSSEKLQILPRPAW